MDNDEIFEQATEKMQAVLKFLAGSGPVERTFLRIATIRLTALGHSPKTISEYNCVDEKTIKRWIQKFKDDGWEGLIDKRGKESDLSTRCNEILGIQSYKKVKKAQDNIPGDSVEPEVISQESTEEPEEEGEEWDTDDTPPISPEDKKKFNEKYADIVADP